MQLLLLSFAALALGPALVALANRARWSTAIVDSFCVVAISGFALLHVLPESAERAGWVALPLCLLGFLAPLLAERGLRRKDARLRWVVLGLCLLGMAVHDTLDGLALWAGCGHEPAAGDQDQDHTAGLLAWGVILHRIPEGVGIWWILPRTLGARAAALVLAVVVLATVFGFFLGPTVLDPSSTQGMAMLQALLAGSLLHVVLHAHIPAPRDPIVQGLHLPSAAGAFAAAAVLWLVIQDHFPAIEGHEGPGQLFLMLALESAPALLLAYLLVGLSQAFLPADWLRRVTRGGPLSQALRGVLIGLPLPVCSCGVVPMYHEMVRRGAALSAAVAFLIATPELEIAAVLLTWQFLGGEMALARVLAAAALALVVGIAIGTVARRSQAPPDPLPLPQPASGPLPERLWAAVRFGYGPAVDNTASWILMGLLLSTVLVPYVDREWIASLPRGADVLVAALLGMPVYVCATGSTPLAAMLIAQGLSPGAGLAFLLTGPATNVTTFVMLARLHGKGVAALFAAAVWLGAVLLGWAVNALVAPPAVPAFEQPAHGHSWVAWTALVLLGAVFVGSLLRMGVRPFLDRLFESPVNLTPAEAAAGGACCHDDDHGHDQAHDEHGQPHGHDHGAGRQQPRN